MPKTVFYAKIMEKGEREYMGESKTLILIDGHALAFRQYYALERTNMKTKDGTPTWAVYGFFKAIFDLLKNQNLAPNAIGVAFDVSHHTFRTEKYEEYKSNREAMPDPMRVQMGLIYEGLRAFNIPIYTKEGFEADDVIGTISRKACELGHKVYILTGDQDSFQLIRKNGCIKVIIPSKGDLIEYDWEMVHEKLGVYPNQVIDYKALRGDTSDNIPGIKGIGEKTAVKLLDEFGTVDNVLANVENISGKALKEKISNGVEIAKLSKYLATIVQDVEIDFDFNSTKIEMPDIAAVMDFLRQMQFYSYLKNIEYILKLFNKDGNFEFSTLSNADAPTTFGVQENGQLGLFAQVAQETINKTDEISGAEIVNDETKLTKLVEELNKVPAFGMKFLVDFKNSINFNLYGLLIGVNPTLKIAEDNFDFSDYKAEVKTYYLPITGQNIEGFRDISKMFLLLKPVFENQNIKKFTHDLKIDDCVLKYYGIDIKGVIFDTLLACYIKDSNANSDFDIQCMEQINHILASMVTDDKKISFGDSSKSVLLNYVADVMQSLFELTKYWAEKLNPREHAILSDIEIPLSKVLADMERAGVSVDKQYLYGLTEELDRKLYNVEQKIFELAGVEFNIKSPKQVGEILYDKLELKSKKRGKSKKSTGAEVLEKLAEEFEIARLILEYRKYSKLITTYTDVLPDLVDIKDNRIHTSFNQTVTTTGRLSSSNPNLQNIPVRTAEGNKIRQAFVPRDRENYLILSADYSQIELRLLAHVSGDKHLIEAFNSGIDVHTLTASKVFEVPVESVTKEMRYKAKAVNFGIVYGQSKYGLAKALKIKPEEAERFINKYFETYSGVKAYMENMVHLVEEQGYVETIFGRRRYLENEINSSNTMVREFAKRAAINHPMQGSSSDLIKIAMVDFAKSLKENKCKSKLILQVHDELVVETAKNEFELVKKLVKDAMELNQPLRVPLLIDINAGETWKEV